MPDQHDSDHHQVLSQLAKELEFERYRHQTLINDAPQKAFSTNQNLAFTSSNQHLSNKGTIPHYTRSKINFSLLLTGSANYKPTTGRSRSIDPKGITR
jgi:hypothetical protein